MTRTRKDAQSIAVRLQRVRDGLCVECGAPSDRAGQLTKAHVPATKCSRCLQSDHETVDRARARAENRRAEMAAALGLTPAQEAELTKRQRARK